MYPNFFILGAPKCGTTSVSSWLSDHPQVYMPALKEPHFFNSSDRHRNITSLQAYKNLFSNVDMNRHRSIGEASVWYLSSRDAIDNILNLIPDAKFIVMLRNPVDMAPSLHQQNIYGLYEDIVDFKSAWDAQTMRQAGRDIPRSCRDARHLFYGQSCSLGHQVEILLSKVKRRMVHFIFLDDLHNNPAESYRAILSFLSLEDDGRNNYQIKNKAKAVRCITMAKIIKMAYKTKLKIGVTRSFGIDKSNIKLSPRQDCTIDMKIELLQYFYSDIDLLAQLTHRDLSGWRNL